MTDVALLRGLAAFWRTAAASTCNERCSSALVLRDFWRLHLVYWLLTTGDATSACAGYISVLPHGRGWRYCKTLVETDGRGV